jgi:hypothetical protein
MLPGLVALVAGAAGNEFYSSTVYTAPAPPPGPGSLRLTINQIEEGMTFDEVRQALAGQLTGEPLKFELWHYRSELGQVGLVGDKGRVSDLFFGVSKSSQESRKMFPRSELVGRPLELADQLIRDRLNAPRRKGMRPDQGRTSHLCGQRWVLPTSEGPITVNRLGQVTIEGTAVYQGHYRIVSLGGRVDEKAQTRFRKGADSYSYSENGVLRILVLVDSQGRVTRITSSDGSMFDG